MKSRGSAFTFVLAAALVISQAPSTPAAAAIIAPTQLNAGGTVNPLPNGDSSSSSIPETTLLDQSEAFSFSDGLSGVLHERVISFSDAPTTDHPGLYFDYEIQLNSGSITSFAISGYSTLDTYVKQCGIANCGGTGSNGVLATDASRSSNGAVVAFDFGNTLTAGEYSANLQIFANTSNYQNDLAFFTDPTGETFSIDAISPAVPELSTCSMTILGFCGLGFMAYLRKRGGAAFAAA